jgi:hypothetical protein
MAKRATGGGQYRFVRYVGGGVAEGSVVGRFAAVRISFGTFLGAMAKKSTEKSLALTFEFVPLYQFQ